MNVDAKATVSEIRKQYRVLAFLYHPDKQGNSAESNQHFALVNEAYSILTDSKKRLEYDLLIVKNNLDYFHNYAIENNVQSLLGFLNKLTRKVNAVSSHDINKSELMNCILMVLDESKMRLIEAQGDQELCNSYFTNIEQLAKKLSYPHLKIIISKIESQSDKCKFKMLILYELINKARKRYVIGLLTPWLILVISILLCMIIYYSRNL